MNKIIITCPNRITPYLSQEVADLGFPIVAENPSSVETEGTMIDTYTLNLHLRTAHRVLYWLKDFTAFNADDLYAKVSEIAWEKYINVQSFLTIDSIIDNPTIANSLFANVRCKDAIVDRMNKKFGQRPNSGSERKGAVIFLYWKNNDVSLYLDTSGETLAKHSYRKHPSLAPLQESLAAAMVYATGWKGESHFVNPMTGSGTLAIEAAMIATKRAPGLLRNNFAFMHYNDFDSKAWSVIRRKASSQQIKKPACQIIASDIDKKALIAAYNNAQTAGVEHLITFEECDFTQTTIPQDESKGIIMLNPEYGERLGEVEELKEVYKGIGDFFKQHCQGYKGYIFTGNPTLAKSIGLHTKRKIPFYNSKIDCRLLEFELYEGSKKVKVEEEN